MDSDESAHLIEPARVTGAGEFSTGIEAVRFQASPHRLTEGSFPVNHPKNYLGYALAVAAEGETQERYEQQVISAAAAGRRGSVLLGLIDYRGGRDHLTHLGAEVVRFAQKQEGSIEAALDRFDDWTGRSTRFTDLAPRWAQLARSVTIQYAPTQLVVDALEQLHADGVRSSTLPQLFEQSCKLNLPLAVEVFITRGRREDVLSPDGILDESAIHDPSVYKSGAYFQFKAQLFHVGLLTVGGKDDAEVALTDEWRLEQPFGGLTGRR